MKLAEAIIENSALDQPKPAGELLKAVGYGEGTAEGGTARIIEREGVQEALAARGFTLDNAKRVVADIMLKESAKDRDRLTAADMTIKVHGGYAPEKHLNVNVTSDLGDERLRGLRAKYERELEQQVLDEGQPL